MGLRWQDWPAGVAERLRAGCVIPAHPLALNAARELDPRRQKALSRYYLAAGAGGLAVGVHTTQFAIRDVGLYPRVLDLAAEAADEQATSPLLVAGVIGRTGQALEEAAIARDLGYHAVLLSLAAWKGASEDEIITHCAAVAAEMPVFAYRGDAAVLRDSAARVVLAPLRRGRDGSEAGGARRVGGGHGHGISFVRDAEGTR